MLGHCKYCCCEHRGACIFHITVFSGYIARSEVGGSYGNSIFSVLSNLILFSIVVGPTDTSPKVYRGSLFSIPPPVFVICSLF